MADRTTHIHDLLGMRAGWTPIGVFLPNPDRVVDRLVELAEQRRWQLIGLGIMGGEPPKGTDLAGAIVQALPTDNLVRQLVQQGVATVRLGSLPHPDDDKVPAIIPDHSAAGRLAAEHFVERGYEHVAFVGRQPWGDRRAVYEGLAARARELGCRCHVLQEDVAGMRSRAKSDADLLALRREGFVRWLAEQPKPLGLTSYSDGPVALFCRWALDAGVRIPEEMAALGIGNNLIHCASAPVPLSSVAFDNDAYADAAIATLARLMAGDALEQTTITVPPAGVVTRQSTDAVAASDPHVVEALRFMWERIDEDLSVDQIARHVGVSRRTLEKAFKQDLGRGINAEFQRRRLAKACELLDQTDLKIVEVAEALGFSGPKYFGEAFRAAYGVTPTQYRRRQRPES